MRRSYNQPGKSSWQKIETGLYVLRNNFLGDFLMQNKIIAAAALSLLVLNPGNVYAEGKGGVAAVVNGEKITVKEMREGYNDNPPIKARVSFDDFYAKALDVYVNGKLLYQAAEAADITDTPEYKKQLKNAQEEIARKIYLEKKVEKKISDDDIDELYEEYEKTFKGEKEVKAKHILVDSESKAKEVIAKLKKGEKFDDLAKKYSKEPAELGYFTKKMMVPEFGEAAFKLKKGKYSETPVKTQFGYHVILVEDIRDAKPLPKKDVEPQLKSMLTQQAIGEVFADLYKNAKITKYSTNFA